MGFFELTSLLALLDLVTDSSSSNRSLTLHDTPVYGQGGMSLDDVWQPEPVAYMSICPAKMPNLFLFVGPNEGPGAGPTIQMSECAAEYMIKCIQKLQRENLRTIVVKYVGPNLSISSKVSMVNISSRKNCANTLFHPRRQRALDAFMRQVDKYFAKTTFSYTVRITPFSYGATPCHLTSPISVRTGQSAHQTVVLSVTGRDPRCINVLCWNIPDGKISTTRQSTKTAWLGWEMGLRWLRWIAQLRLVISIR